METISTRKQGWRDNLHLPVSVLVCPYFVAYLFLISTFLVAYLTGKIHLCLFCAALLGRGGSSLLMESSSCSLAARRNRLRFPCHPAWAAPGLLPWPRRDGHASLRQRGGQAAGRQRRRTERRRHTVPATVNTPRAFLLLCHSLNVPLM